MENNNKVLISINFVKCKIDFIELSLPLNFSIKSLKELLCAKRIFQNLLSREQIIFHEGKIVDDDVVFEDIYAGNKAIKLYIMHMGAQSDSTSVNSPTNELLSVDYFSFQVAKTIQNENNSLKLQQFIRIIESNKSISLVVPKEDVLSPNANITTIVQPQEGEIVQIPQPRWVDTRLLSRLVLGVILFGQGLSNVLTWLLVAVSIIYYLFDTGVLFYFLNYFVRRSTAPSQNNTNSTNTNQPNNTTPPPPPNTFTISYNNIRTTDDILLILKNIFKVPTTSGILLDGISILMSLTLSLLPGWTPDGLPPAF